mmetsp:Transcript_133876/g.232299  ORF Transcript_133876/g.232299 Transcript_133876/m.232299 type:complete len:200 (+) Transcript_133876:4326-4925(+)
MGMPAVRSVCVRMGDTAFRGLCLPFRFSAYSSCTCWNGVAASLPFSLAICSRSLACVCFVTFATMRSSTWVLPRSTLMMLRFRWLRSRAAWPAARERGLPLRSISARLGCLAAIRQSATMASLSSPLSRRTRFFSFGQCWMTSRNARNPLRPRKFWVRSMSSRLSTLRSAICCSTLLLGEMFSARQWLRYVIFSPLAPT